MTAKELIDELNKVSDKRKKVQVHVRGKEQDFGDTYDIERLFENDFKVIIWVE